MLDLTHIKEALQSNDTLRIEALLNGDIKEYRRLTIRYEERTDEYFKLLQINNQKQ